MLVLAEEELNEIDIDDQTTDTKARVRSKKRIHYSLLTLQVPRKHAVIRMQYVQ